MEVHARDYFPPPESQGGWRRLTATEEIRDVFDPGAQRRQFDADDVQAMIQVLTEQAAGHPLLEILALCDGQRTIDDIAAVLSAKYGADVAIDVAEYLSALVERELVVDA